ncbi:MAG: hypothetical protein ABI560_02995 [Myxococcales bacterium]
MSVGCGGGVPGGRPPGSGSDGGSDATGEAGRPPGVMCPPISGGEKRGLGACCAAASDCADDVGVCWNGFCTKTCASTSDCGPVVAPSALTVGTAMACAANKLGDPISYCLPGSLQDCTTSTTSCPPGEGCALGLNPDAPAGTAAGSVAYRGLCLAKLKANAYLPAGETCQPEDGPYACENQGGYLGTGCVAHRCTGACASTSDCPLGTQCQSPPYSGKLGGAVSFLAPSGAGLCLGRFCGQVHGEAGMVTGQVGQQGADSLCVAGDVCVPTMAVGATGNTQYLSCIPPRPGALAFGAACSADPAQGLRCADDSLCAERAGTRFCSRLCRLDTDCPTDSFCVEGYPSPALPNGSVARLSMCTPRSLLPGTVCTTEKTCAATEACLPLSPRTNLLICQPAVGTRSVGQACTTPGECRSGECFDRDLRLPTGANRTYCAAACGRNSDCGTGQLCLRVVRNNNATIDNPLDDIVMGVCTTLDAPAMAGACVSNDNCTGQTSVDETGGDTCDQTHGTCFTVGAHIGDACAHRADCPLGAYCRLNDPRFPGGVCLSQGCDPAATTGVDSCPAGALCTQRPTDSPLNGCYPACPADMICPRVAEGYHCAPADSMPAAGSICFSQGGP